MQLVYDLVVVLHFIGLASLVGGWMVQLGARGERRVLPAMLHGVLTQVVTGLVLVGLAETAAGVDAEVDNSKMGVKLLVALVVLILCGANRRRPTVPDGLFFIIGALSVLNIVVAVLW